MNGLRPRQIQAVEDIASAYRAGFKAPLLRAGTGFGKTHTAATLINRTVAKQKTVWFLAHLKDLLHDTSSRLREQKIKHGFIAAGQLGDRRQSVQLVMVQTLVRRMDMYDPPDLIIIDEAHLAVANSYQKVFKWAKAGPKYYEPGGAHLLHLTATAVRPDGRGMGEVADTIIETCSTQTLIDEGLLCPIKYYAPKTVDTSSLKTLGGDFNIKQNARMMDKPKITGDAIKEYEKVARHRPAIAFCVDIQHAKNVAQAFCDAGYRAVAVSGDSDDIERDAALSGLRDGKLDIVCNCALYVAGIDVPQVACIIMLCPTKSLVKYLQSIGRGLRTHPSKDYCVIIDHAGNINEHCRDGNTPTGPRIWTLAAAPDSKTKKKAEVGEKKCPSCFASVSSLATHCGCGHEFQVVAREILHVEGDLHEIDMGAPQQQQLVMPESVDKRYLSIEELETAYRKRGHKRPELAARAAIRAQSQRKHLDLINDELMRRKLQQG